VTSRPVTRGKLRVIWRAITARSNIMNSQYLNAYLTENGSRGLGKGLTVQSFLASRLQGKAKQYSQGYVVALKRSCERTGAVQGPSFGGSTAYYPAA
jgi:hypothetical protein